MRTVFSRELERLDLDVVRMGALAEAAIDAALLAMAEGDSERAKRVMQGDDEIDALFIDIEKRVMALMAQQQPVARDLRLVIAILKVTNDLERCGDLASNIAEEVIDDIASPRPKALTTAVYELGGSARRLLGRSLDAWSNKDLELAASLDRLDDEIDDQYHDLFKALFALGGDISMELAMHLVLVGRFFERIADHAVNIAEAILYYVTGEHERPDERPE
jgi:phosphate transport system protein